MKYKKTCNYCETQFEFTKKDLKQRTVKEKRFGNNIERRIRKAKTPVFGKWTPALMEVNKPYNIVEVHQTVLGCPVCNETNMMHREDGKIINKGIKRYTYEEPLL